MPMTAPIFEVDGPTKFTLFSLRYTHLLDVLDRQEVVKRISFSFIGAGIFRCGNGWEIENDAEFIKTRNKCALRTSIISLTWITVSGQVTLIAVAFVKPYHTFLLLHALFAMGERSLTTFNTKFITAFYEPYQDPLGGPHTRNRDRTGTRPREPRGPASPYTAGGQVFLHEKNAEGKMSCNSLIILLEEKHYIFPWAKFY
ncbi:hypothetical protein BD779DRAFT_461210 [Infundibulicybe gibba]|nr:hypothetical protein BD779DRAFT_461210 [Infundibulicybe gibba]